MKNSANTSRRGNSSYIFGMKIVLVTKIARHYPRVTETARSKYSGEPEICMRKQKTFSPYRHATIQVGNTKRKKIAS